MSDQYLNQLPPPPPGASTWPWTAPRSQLPARMPDGAVWPRITIVTPSFNQGHYIEETIRSVLLQGYPNLEYIVIDGGSTDESVAIIQRYAPQLAYWVSERDRGQSHAINKGFARASGELLAWLNSDDTLLPGALEQIALAHRQQPNALIAGDVVRYDESTGRERLVQQQGLTFEQIVRFWTKRCIYQQPGIFFPRALYQAVGPVDERLCYAMDYDLFCRLLQQTSAVYVQQPVARFRYHSQSKTGTVGDLFYLESYQVSQRYWASVSPREAQEARRAMARSFSGHALRRIKAGYMRRGLSLYRHALRFDIGVALTTPWAMVFARLAR